jgi:hypothetical protein
MTTHCANSECGTPFRYFRSGKIFLIDFMANGTATRHSRDMEYFWLCGNCSIKMRVTVDALGNMILERLEPPKKPALGKLKVVAKALSA